MTSPTHRAQHPAHTPHAINGRAGGAGAHARLDRTLSQSSLTATLPAPALSAAAARDGDSADEDDDEGVDERLWLTKSASTEPLFDSYYSPAASPAAAAAKTFTATSPAAALTLSASAPTPLTADSSLVDRIGDRMLQQHNELISQRILVDLQHAHDAEVLQLRVKLHKQEQQQRDQKAEHELALRTCKAALERALDDGHALLQRVTELESTAEARRVELERVSVARVDERSASYSQIAELEKSIVLREERLQQRASELRALTVQLEQLRSEDAVKDRRMLEQETKIAGLQAKVEQLQSAKAASAYISGSMPESKYSDAPSRSAASLSTIAEASPDLVVGSASSSVSLQADFVSQLSQRDAQMQAERAAVQSQLSALKLTLTSVTQRADQALSEAAEAHSRQLAFMADRLVLETEAGVKLQRESMEAAKNRAEMDKSRLKEMDAEQAGKAGVTVHTLQMKLLYAESHAALLSQALRLSESRVGVFELADRRCRSLEQSHRNFSHELMMLEANMLAARISEQTQMTEQIRIAEEENAKQRLLLRSMRVVLKDAASGKPAGSASSSLASPSRGSSSAADKTTVSVPSEFLASLSATNLRLGDELAAAKDQLRAADTASQKEKEAYLRRMSELFAQAEKERAEATKHAETSQAQLEQQILALHTEIARMQSLVSAANEKVSVAVQSASQSAHARMPSLPSLPDLPPMPALPELPDLPPSARTGSPAFNGSHSASQPAAKPAMQRSLSVPSNSPAAASVSSLLSPPAGDPLLSHQIHLRVLDYHHVLNGLRTQLDDANSLVAKLQREALPAGQLASITQLQEQVASLEQQLAAAREDNSTSQRSAIKDLIASMQSKHDAAIAELKSQLSAQSLKHAHDLSNAEAQQRQEVALVAVHLRSKQARVESLEASLAALEKKLNGAGGPSSSVTSDGKELQVTRANAALAADISQHSLTMLQSRMQQALEEKTEQMRVMGATHAAELKDLQSKHAATILTLSTSSATVQQQLNDKCALLQQLSSAFVGKESTLLLGAQSQVDSHVLSSLIAAHEKRTAAQLSRIEGLQSELDQSRRDLELARHSESSASSDQTAALQLAHNESANLRMQLATFTAAHDQQRERIAMLERELQKSSEVLRASAGATLAPVSASQPRPSAAAATVVSSSPPSSSDSSTLSSRLSCLLREEESKNVQLQAEVLSLRRQLADLQLLSPTRLSAGAHEALKAEHAEEINAMRNAFAAERAVLQQAAQRAQHEWAKLEASLRAEIADLQSQIDSHTRARAMWEGQVESAHTAYQQRIQATRTEMHSDLQLANDQLRELRSQVADRSATISELRTHNAALVAQLHSLGWPLSPIHAAAAAVGGGDATTSSAVSSPRSVPVSHSSSIVHLRDLNRRVLEHDLELRSSLHVPTVGAHPIASRATAAAAWANAADVASPTRLSPAPAAAAAASMHGYSVASAYSASPLLGSSFAATPPTRMSRLAGSMGAASSAAATATQLSSVPERSSMPSPYRNLHVRTATAGGSGGGGGEGHSSIVAISADRSPPQSPEAPLSARALSARRAAAKARSASSERKAWQKAAGVWK